MSYNRKPQQQRSIENKNKLISAGLKLMRTKGYYNINTVDISKEAGVSTGLCYRYFNNKLEILIAAINQVALQIRTESLAPTLSINNKDSFYAFIEKTIFSICQMHELLGALHNDLITLQYTVPEITNVLSDIEHQLLMQFSTLLEKNNIKVKNHVEKIYIAYNLIEGYAHIKVFGKNDLTNLGTLRTETIDAITNLFFPA